jgi:hypothetical protein
VVAPLRWIRRIWWRIPWRSVDWFEQFGRRRTWIRRVAWTVPPWRFRSRRFKRRSFWSVERRTEVAERWRCGHQAGRFVICLGQWRNQAELEPAPAQPHGNGRNRVAGGNEVDDQFTPRRRIHREAYRLGRISRRWHPERASPAEPLPYVA